MFQDEHLASSLAKDLIIFDYVIVDTCSLMDDNFPSFMDVLDRSRDYIDKNLPIYIPLQCLAELKKHMKDKEDNSKRISAKRAMKIAKEGKKRRILTWLKIEIPKENKEDRYEDFADRAIFVKVSSDRLSQKILVITQDKGLAKDLLALNDMQSQIGRWLVVKKVSQNGELVANKGEDRYYSKANHSSQRPDHRSKPKEEIKLLKKPEPKKPLSDGLLKIQANDTRLSANLSNPNYPLDKKVADLKAQITEIGKHKSSELAGLSLNFTQQKLQEHLKGLSLDLKAVHIKQDADKREAKRKEKEAGTRLWYGVGDTLPNAFSDCLAHYGYIVRDVTIAYVPQVHGKLDLTTVELKKAIAELEAKLQGERRESVQVRAAILLGQKVNDRYRAWIDANPQPAKEGAPKEEPKEAEPAEPKAEEKPKKAAKPAKKAKTEAKKVEEPKEKKESTAAPKAKAPAKKKAKVEPAPEEKKKPEEKPAKKSEKKAPAPKAKAKEEAPKTKEAKSKQEPKVEEAPATEKPSKMDDAFAKAKASEKRLQALIPNPNYKKEEKVKDLQAHLQLIGPLPKEMKDQLTLQPEAIKALISVLK